MVRGAGSSGRHARLRSDTERRGSIWWRPFRRSSDQRTHSLDMASYAGISPSRPHHEVQPAAKRTPAICTGSSSSMHRSMQHWHPNIGKGRRKRTCTDRRLPRDARLRDMQIGHRPSLLMRLDPHLPARRYRTRRRVPSSPASYHSLPITLALRPSLLAHQARTVAHRLIQPILLAPSPLAQHQYAPARSLAHDARGPRLPPRPPQIPPACTRTPWPVLDPRGTLLARGGT